MGRLSQNTGKLDLLVESIRRQSRIPGAAIAVVADGKMIFANGYGYRDLAAELPVTAETIYPIASTTKALNTTLLGMLVDEGHLSWDMPVRQYLPHFQLQDLVVSAQVTVRDLLIMRTGLPRHDWLWIGNPMSRKELVERLQYVDFSATFREKFQYNNLTATTAGHIAEVITGKSWETLVQERILEPLGMSSTRFRRPEVDNVTLSYHEDINRKLVPTRQFAMEVTAPSGGAIHSSVVDMARWVAFNLNGGEVDGCPIIQSQTLADIHSPQMVVGADPAGSSPHASYAMGWFVDTYNGESRLSHGGYIHDVNSDVMLFPQHRLGFVCFTNFGCQRLAGFINQCAFDVLMGFEPVTPLDEKLALYEKKIDDTRAANASVRRVAGTSPSHPLDAYEGVYVHPGYGRLEIHRAGEQLIFKRNDLCLPLEHWHYDSWVAGDQDLFAIHVPHAFDRASRMLFETNADGEIAALSLRLEPAVAPIRFSRYTS